MRILIAGAGIAGLAAALNLHRVGFTDVRVLEAARDLNPIGVGLNILPNAVSELATLGLADRLTSGAVATRELAMYNRHGQLIWREPRGREAGFRWPQLSIRRSFLQGTLAAAVRERLGPGAVVTDARVVGFDQPSDGPLSVDVTGDGTGLSTFEGVDVLVGADGVRSTIRRLLYPDEGGPVGNGITMWRAMSWVGSFLDSRTMVVTGDDVQRVVMYPVATDQRRGVLVNWVAAQPLDLPAVQSFGEGRQRPISAVLERFGGWGFEWLDIAAILGSTPTALEYPMVDRDPLPAWTFGRVTLVGDAAHAMYPMGSSGATQAIVGARALADNLAAGVDAVEQALLTYDAERRPAMTALQTANRHHGPEAVITLAHRRAPDGFSNIHDIITEDELVAISSNYARIAGLDERVVGSSAGMDGQSA